MNSLLEQYLEAHRLSQKELLDLLQKGERKGSRSLNGTEIEKLGSLYLRSVTRLAQERSRGLDPDLVDQLNNLAARSHAILYSQPKRSPPQIGLFFKKRFPALVAKTWAFHLLAFLILTFGGLAGYQMVQNDPSYYYTIFQGEARTPGASREELKAILLHGREASGGYLTYFTSHLFFHNTKVGLTAWVTGILLGIPTILLTFYNGLMLGAMTQVYVDASLSLEWAAWVLPHGVTELLAIILCSGAGLYLGYSLIDPKDKSRKDILKERGRESLMIGLGTFPLFLIAAFIEGFIRQSNLPDLPRILIVLLSLLGWMAYFTIFSKVSDPNSSAEREG